MKFDVVIMNPPYQVGDNGHSKSAKPLYNTFIERVIDTIRPRYMVSINPSRWMAGGKGLAKFRKRMKADKHIRTIVDNQSANGIFPSVDIAGGVNYWLWDRRYKGRCTFNGVKRDLDAYDIVVRDNESISILEKVLKGHDGQWIGDIASPRNPYGLRGNEHTEYFGDDGVPCWFKQSIGRIMVDPKSVKDKGSNLNKWRVLVPNAMPGSGGSSMLSRGVLWRRRGVIVAKPGEYGTGTFIVLKAFDTEQEAEDFKTYIYTRFFRFMLRMRTATHQVSRHTFDWVPDITDSRDLSKWRVLVPGVTPGNLPLLATGKFFNRQRLVVAKPGECCSETFVVLKAFNTKQEAKDFVEYVYTRFFRFMLRMRVTSQNISRHAYDWVPDTKPITDEQLYKRFGITPKEQAFIASKIKELQ